MILNYQISGNKLIVVFNSEIEPVISFSDEVNDIKNDFNIDSLVEEIRNLDVRLVA